MDRKHTESCLECENCIYIGEGDYICDELHEIVIEDFGQPTVNRMLCRQLAGDKR